METEVIVGIFTLVGVLGGITIGAILNYFLLERSRRKERIDLIQEETMDALNEYSVSLMRISTTLKELGEASTKRVEDDRLKRLIECITSCQRDLSGIKKACSKMLRYVKSKGPIYKSISKVADESVKFSDLCLKFASEYPKSKSSQFSKQLKNRTEEILEALREADRTLQGR